MGLKNETKKEGPYSQRKKKNPSVDAAMEADWDFIDEGVVNSASITSLPDINLNRKYMWCSYQDILFFSPINPK